MLLLGVLTSLTWTLSFSSIRLLTLKRFHIDVVGQPEQGGREEHGYCSLGEKLNTLVSQLVGEGLACLQSPIEDFMAIRKIPINERGYLTDGDQMISVFEGGDNTRPEDPGVSIFLAQIRKTLLTDRTLNDQVGFLKSFNGPLIHTNKNRLQRHLCRSFAPTQSMRPLTFSG